MRNYLVMCLDDETERFVQSLGAPAFNMKEIIPKVWPHKLLGTPSIKRKQVDQTDGTSRADPLPPFSPFVACGTERLASRFRTMARTTTRSPRSSFGYLSVASSSATAS